MKKIITTVACASIALASQASLINAGFESPAIGNGVFTASGIPGWTWSSTSGVWNIPAQSFFEAEAPEGTQIGYANDSNVSQVSTTQLLLGLNEITFVAGRRADSFAGSFTVEMWAGGSASSGNIVGGTLLSSVDFDHLTIAPNSFVPMSVTYTATSGDPLVGQFIGVRIVQTTGVQANFDNFQVNPVPEPATLFGVGAGLFAFLRRKRK